MDKVDVAFRLYRIECDLKALASLLAVLIDRINGIDEHADPACAATMASDLALVAFNYLVNLSAEIGSPNTRAIAGPVEQAEASQ